MEIIGLTGGIGSGKSTVSDIIRKNNFEVIDADEISRNILTTDKDVIAEVVKKFGENMLDEDGNIDRREIAILVFEDEVKLKELNDIVHPAIIRAIDERIDALEKSGAEKIFLDVPLLFETGLDQKCDETWVVTSKMEDRIKRVVERDGVEAEDVKKRIENQMTDEERIQRASLIISNNSTVESLENILKVMMM